MKTILEGYKDTADYKGCQIFQSNYYGLKETVFYYLSDTYKPSETSFETSVARFKVKLKTTHNDNNNGTKN